MSVNQTISSTKNGVYTTLKPPEIDFVPIILEQKDRNTSAKPFEMSGVMSCGKGVDLVWGASGSKEVFLMETKGQLRKIFEADNRHGFGLAVFDGQYAWLPVTGPESRVLAINPMTDEIVQFTSEDGLPVFQFVALASIGVGRLCLSAGFGKQTDRRAFIAVLELSNPRGKEIRIIHEATQQLMPNTPPSIQHLDPRISYVPKFMISSLDETEQSWMVVLGRIMPGSSLYNPSLLIKPDTASVEVIDPHVETDIAPQNVAFKEHAAYWNNGMGLRCLRTDSKNSEVVRVLPGEGRVMFYNGRLHVVGIDWWIVDEGENPFRKLSVKMPSRRVYSFQFFVSSHYGLVFRAEDSLYKNYQVVFLNE